MLERFIALDHSRELTVQNDNDDACAVPASARERVELTLSAARRLQDHFETLARDNAARSEDSFRTISNGPLLSASSRVYASSLTLIKANDPYHIAEQLEVGLDGLGLIGTCDYDRFFGDIDLRGNYGKALDELRVYDIPKACSVLDRFETQCKALTKDYNHSHRLHSWIENERGRLQGVPPRLLGFKLN